MADTKIRVGGSGFTTFRWRGNNIANLQTIQDTAPTPVAQAVPIQSITDPTPTEIVTARAVGAGTLRLTFYELFAKSAWQTLIGLSTSLTLLDILKNQVALGEIICTKVIFDPNGNPRVKTYHGCKVVDADEGETVNIASMVMPKSLTIMYTKASIA
jgi:hypothetical protein